MKKLPLTKLNEIGTLTDNSAKSNRICKVKKRITSTVFAAVTVATSGFILQTPTPVLADHRDVGDRECSWFVDSVPGFYNFHEACTNHDACGEIAGSDQQAWDRCDEQLLKDASAWCYANHSFFSPIRKRCLGMAVAMYGGLRVFVTGTGIHRD